MPLYPPKAASVSPVVANATWAQATWFIDPANVSGVAADTNTGVDRTHPVRTWNGGVIAKYGTLEPTLRQATSWEFMSDAVTGDSVIFRPNLVLDNSAVATNVIVFRGSLGTAQQVSAGTITVTLADGGSNLLTVTLPAGATYAVNQRVHNTTKGAYAWLHASVSGATGATWQLSPPVVSPPTTYAAGNAFPLKSAAWATGDSVVVQNLVKVDLAEVAPVLVSILPGIDDCAFVTDLRIYNPDPVDGFQPFTPGQLLDLINVVSDRVVLFPTGVSPFSSYYTNCSFVMGIGGGEHASQDGTTGPVIAGGMLGVGTQIIALIRMAGVTLDLGVVIAQTYAGFLPPSVEGGYIGEVYLDETYGQDGVTQLLVLGNVQVDGTAPAVFGALAMVRGPGSVNVDATGRLKYNGTAVGIFVNGGGLQLNGLATADAVGNASGIGQFSPGRTLTPAALDATVAAGGFGGAAQRVGGGCITNGAATPTAPATVIAAATTTTRGIVTLAGDFASSSTADVPRIGSLGGASPLAITPATLQWLAATAAPTLTQATPTSDIAPANLTITPQAPFATATTNKSPASLVVKLATPGTGGSHGFLQINDSGTPAVWLGSVTSGYGQIWLGAAPAGSANQTLASNGQTAYITASQFIYFSTTYGFFAIFGGSTAGRGLTLLYPTGLSQFGGGDNVLSIGAALVNPTSSFASGVIAYVELSSNHFKSRSPGGVVTTFAPNNGGTVNSQKQLIDQSFGTCRTVSSATATTVASYATASGTCATAFVRVSCRAVTAPTSGAIGDACTFVIEVAYRNVAGTVTLIGSGYTSVAPTKTDSSMSTTAVNVIVSGTNLVVQVVNVASATVDAQCRICPDVN